MTTIAKPNALNAIVSVSPDLQAIVGTKPISRGEITKRLWAYIKGANPAKVQLQNPDKKTEIIPDAALLKVFGGKKKVGMMEIPKFVNLHIVKPV
jgi:upstream activation factor subunit UAF30